MDGEVGEWSVQYGRVRGSGGEVDSGRTEVESVGVEGEGWWKMRERKIEPESKPIETSDVYTLYTTRTLRLRSGKTLTTH